MSWGKHGLGPHGWPMYNPKATCYGLKLCIFTLDHDLGRENHPWCIKPSFKFHTTYYSHDKDFVCMAYVVA